MAAAAVTGSQRDQKTSSETSGVWIKPGHWASVTVHAFWRWTGETALLTWCGLEANMADGARLTTDTITCVQCAQASLRGVMGHAAY